MTGRPIAFLFLGETLLIPHLYPIAAATATLARDVPIDLWVSTSVHERLLERWTATLDAPHMRVRRAPGFRQVTDDGEGRNPILPAKLPMLARLAPRLARASAVVCAEQTSLWLPTLLPMPTPFIKVPHGAGSLMKRNDRRRRAAWLTLVPAERERTALGAVGVPEDRIAVTGYAKAEFDHRTPARALFADRRPVILYNPHWQQHRSSWWRWGPAVVEAIIASDRYNLIFAPHQRLVERAENVSAICNRLATNDHVNCDFTSFATVDGSYTAAADIYLGDTSSQIVEFLIRPRPSIFLNAHQTTWQGDPAYDMWRTGAVVDDLAALMPALDEAQHLHPSFINAQRQLVADQLGVIDGHAAERAATAILEAVHHRD